MSTDSITIGRPDDWHLHLRDGGLHARLGRMLRHRGFTDVGGVGDGLWAWGGVARLIPQAGRVAAGCRLGRA